MTSAPFVSDMLADPKLIIMKMEADHFASQDERATRGPDAFVKGLPIAEDDCPRKIWSDTAGPLARLPAVSNINGYFIVSDAAADVLRQFDLGAGALYPVAVLQYDRVTPAKGSWFTWGIGNQKTAFREAQSPAARPFATNRNRCKLPMLPKDDDIAVSVAALDGPDIWVDPTLFKSIFVSGPLGEALTAAGLAKAFRLFRCRLVD